MIFKLHHKLKMRQICCIYIMMVNLLCKMPAVAVFIQCIIFYKFKMTNAIYPGTFDPITKGHMDIIRRAAKIFPNLMVAVAEDVNKSPIFSVDERVALIKAELAEDPLLKQVKVSCFKGLLMDFARENSASVIVRGLRAASDFEYEFQMAYMNKKLCSDIETIFITASENSHFISSRFVKELARLSGNLEGFVSNNVANKLKLHYGK